MDGVVDWRLPVFLNAHHPRFVVYFLQPPQPVAAYGSVLARYLPEEYEGRLSGRALRSHLCE